MGDHWCSGPFEAGMGGFWKKMVSASGKQRTAWTTAGITSMFPEHESPLAMFQNPLVWSGHLWTESGESLLLKNWRTSAHNEAGTLVFHSGQAPKALLTSGRMGRTRLDPPRVSSSTLHANTTQRQPPWSQDSTHGQCFWLSGKLSASLSWLIGRASTRTSSSRYFRFRSQRISLVSGVSV